MGTTTLEVKILQQLTDTRKEFLHAILLDLYKAYNDLDRSRRLEILKVYDVGTRALCLLCRYWERLQMVARTGEYYGEPFHGERGVMQGDPLLPTKFNVVVDAVLCHWESLVVEGAGRYNISVNEAAHPVRWTIKAHNNAQRQTKEGLKSYEDIFYADAGMVASANPGCLRTAFDTMTGLFDRVGLKKNVWETVGMV